MISGNLLKQYENIISSLSKVVLTRVDGVVSNSSGKKNGKKSNNVQVFINSETNVVTVDVSVCVFSDRKVTDVAFNIQEEIKKDVESATMFKVKAVNVKVVDVIFV